MDQKEVKTANKVNLYLYVQAILNSGNKPAAKEVVTEILTQYGWESEDVGKAESDRAIEPLRIVWCIPGFQSNTWNYAFKLFHSYNGQIIWFENLVLNCLRMVISSNLGLTVSRPQNTTYYESQKYQAEGIHEFLSRFSYWSDPYAVV